MPWSSSIYVYSNRPSHDYVTQTVIIVVMLLLCYHLWFQIDFTCPCSSQNFIQCNCYMLLPYFIIFSLVLWNDKRIGRIFRYGCYYSKIKKNLCKGKFCFEFFIYVLQAATSGLLWCGSVLVDGDWYVCCGNTNTEEVKTLSCLMENKISQSEKTRKITLKKPINSE